MITPDEIYMLAIEGNEARRNFNDQLAEKKLSQLFFIAQKRPSLVVKPQVTEEEYLREMGNAFRNLSLLTRNFETKDLRSIAEYAYYFISKSFQYLEVDGPSKYERLVFLDFLTKRGGYLLPAIRLAGHHDSISIPRIDPLNAMELIIFYNSLKVGDYITHWSGGRHFESGEHRLKNIRIAIERGGYNPITSVEMTLSYVESLNNAIIDQLAILCFESQTSQS